MSESIRDGKTTYAVSDLSIPGLRHFVYKSRPHVQVTMPEYEEPYDEENEKRRFVCLNIMSLYLDSTPFPQIDHALSDSPRQHTRQVRSREYAEVAVHTNGARGGYGLGKHV